MEATQRRRQTQRRARQTKVGRVVSDKMDKTIVVEVERRVQERRYQRTIKRTAGSTAHDEDERGEGRRPGPDRGDPAALEAQALAAARSPDKRRRRSQP